MTSVDLREREKEMEGNRVCCQRENLTMEALEGNSLS